jgi:hypothetical protein
MTQHNATSLGIHLTHGGASLAEAAAYVAECDRARASEEALLAENERLREALAKFTVGFEFSAKQAGPEAEWSLGYWGPDRWLPGGGFCPVIAYTPELVAELRSVAKGENR